MRYVSITMFFALLFCGRAVLAGAKGEECRLFLKNNRAEIKEIKKAIEADDADLVLRRSMRMLDRRGVEYLYDANELEIQIVPSSKSSLNRLARSMMKFRGIKLVYNPSRLIFKKVRGSFSSNKMKIFLPHGVITDLRPQPTTIHEILHAVLHKKEVLGQMSLFHGSVRSLEMGKAISDSKLYKSYMSFEELATFAIGMRTSLTFLKNHSTKSEFEKAMELTRANLKSGTATAEQTIAIAKMSLEKIGSDHDAVKFTGKTYKDGGLVYVEAKITIDYRVVTIPIHEKGASDEELRFLLKSKLESLLEVSEKLRSNYSKVEEFLEKHSGSLNLSEEEKLTLQRLVAEPRKTAKESEAMFLDSWELSNEN